jgi:hypothetical protein
MDAVGDRWETREEVLAARDRYEASLAGYERPARFGVGWSDGPSDAISFPYICEGDHPLPAAVLATVCGHRAGSATYELTLEQLDEAIERLAPAGACAAFDHPNLAAWRDVRATVDAAAPGRRPSIVAFFGTRPETLGGSTHD